MSQLRKCLAEEDAVIDSHQPELQPNLSLPEKPKKILDRKDQVLRNKIVKLVKVLWNDQTEEATWEREDAILLLYLNPNPKSLSTLSSYNTL